ncbi:MobH family relaxase [Pseudomonas aeruginosa]|uniref:MobH family relaxase n=2 Tax=Pseudomonas aeruginosa TaxID=287 RepID=UPI0006584832|nr:MobH family relaxase [Pseudomonas aeruginosa]EIU3423099.1 TraI domain-containing protein [Pseudomonas aeruginosa]EIU5126583.1 DNA-binding domain-containing protein [Pseudomonas aeruginosa]EIU5193402.1 DNA-binding domain-containing protein [Pseudomonas aeruginosa]EIY2627763.1 TraI domain-containing protein [Pseudomonas aeruginosa]EJS3669211.1 TraI domain-containing protein [Pseudomonas aeruginosa]
MFQLLSWISRKPSPSQLTKAAPGGFLPPLSSMELLGTPRRRQLLENIWQRASLSKQQFEEIYRRPLANYAELVQQLPASENHHHAHPGGMIDHGLEIVAYALKVRQTYLLPIGAAPESQSAQAEAWSAAAAYGALAHDIGKIVVDLQVELQDGSTWHPWNGPINQPYRFKYVKSREYQLHGAASALLIHQLLPRTALDWLSRFPELWAQLIYLFAGQYEHAGILGEIIVKADQASVAQELGGNPDRALAAPKQSLQRQLADGLRFLVKDKFKLNQPGGPSDGWLTQDALWLVSKPVSDQLRAYLLAQGIEGVPSSNSTLFNMLQDQAIIQTNAEDKAIWTATVDNGAGWRNKFTLLKIAPALIWTDPAERPAPYSGSLVVADGNTSTEKSETTCEIPIELVEQPQVPEAKMTLRQPAPRVAKPSTDDQEETDDLYALLGSINSPPEELDTSHDSSAASPTNTRGEENLQQPLGTAEPADYAPETVEDVFMPSRSTDLGQRFVGWMKSGIAARRLFINDTKALVHTVDGTAMLVTPGIFKRYVQEHPELEKLAQAKETNGWKLVQRAFEKQNLHRKTSKSLNIWTIKVSGPRKTKELKAYLLQDPTLLFPEQPLDNPSLTVINDAEGGAQ